MINDDIWVFMKYIVKKPFVDLLQIIKRFNNPKAWLYLSGIAYINSRFVNLGFWSDGLLIIFVLSIVWHEYIKGDWKREWREQYRQQIKK